MHLNGAGAEQALQKLSARVQGSHSFLCRAHLERPGTEQAFQRAPDAGGASGAVLEQVVVEDAGRARVRQNVHVALYQVARREGPVPLRRACSRQIQNRSG